MNLGRLQSSQRKNSWNGRDSAKLPSEGNFTLVSSAQKENAPFERIFTFTAPIHAPLKKMKRSEDIVISMT